MYLWVYRALSLVGSHPSGMDVVKKKGVEMIQTTKRKKVHILLFSYYICCMDIYINTSKKIEINNDLHVLKHDERSFTFQYSYLTVIVHSTA